MAANTLEVMCIVACVELVGLAVGIAAFLSACTAASVNFVLNKFWAFGCKTPISRRQVATYAGVMACTATFNAVTIQVGSGIVGIPYLLAWLFAAVLVFVLWSYPAQSRLVFATPANA